MKHFNTGPKKLRNHLNDQTDGLNTLLGYNLRGDGIIEVIHLGGHGQTLRLNMNLLKQRLAHSSVGSGNSFRRAFVKATPGATTSVDVFLDTDASDSEVAVECHIYGGGNLEDAYPTLVDGMPLYVINDNGTWRNVTSIYKIGTDCSG